MFLFYFNLLVDGLTGSMLGKIRYDPTIGYRMSDVGCRMSISDVGYRMSVSASVPYWEVCSLVCLSVCLSVYLID